MYGDVDLFSGAFPFHKRFVFVTHRYDDLGLGNASRLLIVGVNESAQYAQLEWQFVLPALSAVGDPFCCCFCDSLTVSFCCCRSLVIWTHCHLGIF